MQEPNAKWQVFDTYTGWFTRADASKLQPGQSPNGQNTVVNNGDRVSVRNFGTTLFGDVRSALFPTTSLHTFRKRSGENIMMQAYDTVLEYYDKHTSAWTTLKTGYTSGQRFGFSDYNINTDQHSYVYFGNAVENGARWSGDITYLTAPLTGGETVIPVNDTTGFAASGTIIYNGTEIAYSSLTPTTFVVASAHAAPIDTPVAFAVESSSNYPKGNIYHNSGNRLFIAGIRATPQAVYFSKYGDPTDYTSAALVTSTTADDPGIFNLAEGGGPVTNIGQDEQAIYMFKRAITYKVTLTDSLYTLETLKPFDGKSQTTGASSSASIFAVGNGIFFVSPDNQIQYLTRMQLVDYPQIDPLSEFIKPTVALMDFSSMAGIGFQNTAYIATKATSASTSNDTVLQFNLNLKVWELPIIGWNPSCFTVYDDGTGDALYYGDANSAAVWKVTPGSTDNGLGIKANWRSRQHVFGDGAELYEVTNMFVEGYITDNTNITISLLADDNGFTQTYTTTFSGLETTYLFDTAAFNLFGFHPFGFERFGSSDESGKKKFRVYLNKSFKRIQFYNIQVEFASDDVGQSWEILRYGLCVRKFSQPLLVKLFRKFF